MRAKKAATIATATRRRAADAAKKGLATAKAATVARRTVAPAVLTLRRSTVATPFGPFSIFTDADGAVRWCNWVADEKVKLRSMQERWYKGTIFRIEQGCDLSKTKGEHCDAGEVVPAAAHLDRYFNPSSEAAANPQSLQRELDAIPVAMPPTAAPYTARIWQTLREEVRAGEYLSYKSLGELELSKQEVQGKRGNTAVPSRAVGQAMACNPVVVIVPCHRVLGSDKTLHGYGCGLEKKAWLLKHEGVAEVAPETKITAV